MNIAMVVYGGEDNSFGKTWCTPLGLKIGWEKLGHLVEVYQMNPKNCDLSSLEKQVEKYDFVWVGWPWISESLDVEIKKIKRKIRRQNNIALGRRATDLWSRTSTLNIFLRGTYARF